MYHHERLMLSWRALITFLFCSAILFTPAVMVKEYDFKKSDQSGFCKRNRAYGDKAVTTSGWEAPYKLAADSITFKGGLFKGIVRKTINKQGQSVRLPLTISFLKSGVARVSLDEERRQAKDIELRHGSAARKERYNEAEKWAIVGGLLEDDNAQVAYEDKTQKTIKYGPESSFEAVITYAPFAIDFKRDGVTQIKLNDRGLLNLEHWRPKVEKPAVEESSSTTAEESSTTTTAEPTEESSVDAPEDKEGTWWEETFGGTTDSKPRGPESIALDISFVGFENVYGIPSHAGPLALKETRGGEGQYTEPYRLYNADVFEYVLDSPMTLYGSIPFMQAHRKGSSAGVFWLNGAETWVDIVKAKEHKNPLAIGTTAKTTTQTHWISESGIMDVFVFLGPTPQDITRSYGELTGFTAMPQEFALGYHQCRWNYVSDNDVKDVDRKMDKSKIPYDVIWLDIEYTDGKKYFTWDGNMFKDPIGMGKQLAASGRQLVTIIDPHIKNEDGYHVVSQMKSKELAVKDKNKNIFEGWCWPGSSHWIDAFNPAAIQWWGTLFKYDAFKGTQENTWVWNDMNEPSVFNGPEVTMPKDNLHHGDWEHRDLHNIMGMTFHNATHQALMSRKKGELRRPFVLTRSFFAGSQRLGAMWTGDNQASWEHLGAAISMLLSQGISGFPFSGSDVGGFFGNPDQDLQARWYQSGAFYPFFRGHAHIDSRRREPYLLSEPYVGIATAALRLRYSLLPVWYTAFHQAHQDGSPIIRPMFFTNPSDEGSFAIDDQLFVGSTGLLFKPVVEPGQDSVDIYIPDDSVYYDYFTYDIISTRKGKYATLEAPLEKIPLLMQSGHIFPRRDIPRRSSTLMRFDDYTLVITLPKSTPYQATGELYVDDGDTFDFEKGQYIHRSFSFDGSSLSSSDFEGRNLRAAKETGWLAKMHDVYVAKVIVVGAPAAWATLKEVKVESAGKTWTAEVDYVPAEKGRAAYAVVRRTGARIGADWKMDFA